MKASDIDEYDAAMMRRIAAALSNGALPSAEAWAGRRLSIMIDDALDALRAADMAAHEAREKLSFADQVRAFFHRSTHRGSPA